MADEPMEGKLEIPAASAPTAGVYSTSDDTAWAHAQGRGWRAATAAREERKEEADMWGP